MKKPSEMVSSICIQFCGLEARRIELGMGEADYSMGAKHLAPFPRVINKCKEDQFKEVFCIATGMRGTGKPA